MCQQNMEHVVNLCREYVDLKLRPHNICLPTMVTLRIHYHCTVCRVKPRCKSISLVTTMGLWLKLSTMGWRFSENNNPLRALWCTPNRSTYTTIKHHICMNTSKPWVIISVDYSVSVIKRQAKTWNCKLLSRSWSRNKWVWIYLVCFGSITNVFSLYQVRQLYISPHQHFQLEGLSSCCFERMGDWFRFCVTHISETAGRIYTILRNCLHL